MTPYFEDATVRLYAGDCLDVLRELPEASVDSVCTDPPYNLGFMGQKWDTYRNETGRAPSANAKFDHVGGNHNPSNSADSARTRRVEGHKFQAWCELWATECLRVLRPGGHMLAFGGTRTSHRLACAIEDAGFEIRDSIAWLYGSGFPKSLDVSAAIDKAAGVTREVVGRYASPEGTTGPRSRGPGMSGVYGEYSDTDGTGLSAITAPATDAARTWDGWHTAMKPAHEPVVVARKPLAGTVAANVLRWGTGGINVDACRVGTGADKGIWPKTDRTAERGSMAGPLGHKATDSTVGRWPANVVLDGEMAGALDEQSGELSYNPPARWVGGTPGTDGTQTYGKGVGVAAPGETRTGFGDTGGASRFFFVAPIDQLDTRFLYTAKAGQDERVRVNGVAHPTVKPLSLIRWLQRLVTPPGGTTLDLFGGSGTAAEAAILEGFRIIIIEREPDYLPLIVQRVNRRRDPVAAVRAAGLEDAGLFDLLGPDEGPAA